MHSPPLYHAWRCQPGPASVSHLQGTHFPRIICACIGAAVQEIRRDRQRARKWMQSRVKGSPGFQVAQSLLLTLCKRERVKSHSWENSDDGRNHPKRFLRTTRRTFPPCLSSYSYQILITFLLWLNENYLIVPAGRVLCRQGESVKSHFLLNERIVWDNFLSLSRG